jgi:hypothetical protein
MDPRKKGPFSYGQFIFDFEPFYIGKGKKETRGRKGRLIRHLTDYCLKIDVNKLKVNIIKKIRKETGQNPITRIYKENLTDRGALDMEIQMIRAIGRRDLKTGPLANLTDGGETTNLSIEAREKIRKSKLGIPRSEDTKQKLRMANLGKKHSSATIIKMKNNPNHRYWLGKKLSAKTRAKIGASVNRVGTNNGNCHFIYNLVSPEGIEFKGVKSLQHFCANKKLLHSGFRRASRKGWKYQGWQATRYPKEILKCQSNII